MTGSWKLKLNTDLFTSKLCLQLASLLRQMANKHINTTHFITFTEVACLRLVSIYILMQSEEL